MTMPRPARSLALLAALAALGGLVLLAASAQAQGSLQGDVLTNESSPIGFAKAEDTVIEETDERPADRRVDLDGAALRGPNTVSEPGEDEGRRDLLLSLSASGGVGIDEEVRDRYRNGNVEDAFLEVSYDGGCNSPNGQLTVNAIEDASWSPFDIAWSDTTRSNNGTLDVTGPQLARISVSPSAAQSNPHVTCTQATMSLDTEHVEAILTGEMGGLALLWSGEQELTVSTLDSDDPPVLDVNLTTNAPTVHEIRLEEELPLIVDTGRRFTISVNATDAQGLPDDAVTANLTPVGDGDHHASLEATRTDVWFTTTHTFPNDAEGRYELSARVQDTDGWQDTAAPNASTPHVVADGSPPEVLDARLGTADPNATLTREEGRTVPLEAEVSDLSCQAHRSPCGDWQLEWRGLTLANGSLDPSQTIEADVPLPRPGNTTARFVVTDVPGHANETTSWRLDVEDTTAPGARPLEDTHLAPGRATTLENGTSIELAFAIEDDLPVEVRLLLEGTQAFERELPDHDEEGHVHTEIDDVPEGTYQARLVLDDGNHTNPVPFGELTIAPKGAPSVAIDHATTRVGPQPAIDVTVRDRDLDDAKTRIVAEVNGLEVQPDVDVTPVEGGQDLTVHLDDLADGDELVLTTSAQDAQGLRSTAKAELTVDAEAPTLVEPDGTTWLTPGESLGFHAEDEAGGAAQLTIQTATTTIVAESPRSVKADRIAQPGQLSPVEIGLTDDLGNERNHTVQVGVDEDPPEAEPGFTDDGLVIHAEDAASGVLRVDAWVSVNDGAFNETQVFQESPTRFFVATGPLTRGDEVTLAADVRDEVGHVATVGTPEDPLNLTVPDRPPALTLERASPAIGDEAAVNWTASDPDEDPIDVTLTVEQPSGQTDERSVDRIGSHTFAADETGRHVVTVEARSTGNASQAERVFHLSPDGTLTRTESAPSGIDAGGSLTVDLSFPAPPQQVFVTAIDEAEASTSARVELSGDTARATFDELPEGDYDIEATVVHEEGAVETVHVASVQSQQPIGERLSSLLIPLLLILAIGLIVAIAAVWYKRRQEEEEAETEAAERGPA